MAGWRQAVELAMTGEEIETLTTLSGRGPSRRAGYRGRRCCSAIGRSRRSLPWDAALACTIRRSSAASSGPWPMAYWRPSTTDRDRARSRRSRRKPRPGWYRWRATRPRSTAIRTSCGRRGCWPGTRASTDRRRGMTVSPIGAGHGVQDSRSRGNQVAQGALLSGTPRPTAYCPSSWRLLDRSTPAVPLCPRSGYTAQKRATHQRRVERAPPSKRQVLRSATSAFQSRRHGPLPLAC
jgi:hypothetical protein